MFRMTARSWRDHAIQACAQHTVTLAHAHRDGKAKAQGREARWFPVIGVTVRGTGDIFAK